MVVNTCRWLGYVHGLLQFIPCSPDGLTLPAGTDPNAFRLPPGYLEEDDDPDNVRCCWTQQPQQVRPDTWCKNNVLKYSAQEMLGRGETAEEVLGKVESGNMTHTAATKALRQLGLKGATMFTALSYFKCAPHAGTCHPDTMCVPVMRVPSCSVPAARSNSP